MAVETIKNEDGTVTLKDNTEDTKEDSPEIDLNKIGRASCRERV